MNQFIQDLKEWNIVLSEDQLILFDKYKDLLLEWNEKINLTAITDVDEIYKKHFLDSLSLVKCIDNSLSHTNLDTNINDSTSETQTMEASDGSTIKEISW